MPPHTRCVRWLLQPLHQILHCPAPAHLGAEGAWVEAPRHEGAKDVVDGSLAGRRHVEDGKLALEAVGDVVAPGARHYHGRHKPVRCGAGRQQAWVGWGLPHRCRSQARWLQPSCLQCTTGAHSSGNRAHPPTHLAVTVAVARVQPPKDPRMQPFSQQNMELKRAHSPRVHHKLHVADGLLQAVHAALLQQLAHNLVGDLRRGGGGVGGSIMLW